MTTEALIQRLGHIMYPAVVFTYTLKAKNKEFQLAVAKSDGLPKVHMALINDEDRLIAGGLADSIKEAIEFSKEVVAEHSREVM